MFAVSHLSDRAARDRAARDHVGRDHAAIGGQQIVCDEKIDKIEVRSCLLLGIKWCTQDTA